VTAQELRRLASSSSILCSWAAEATINWGGTHTSRLMRARSAKRPAGPRAENRVLGDHLGSGVGYKLPQWGPGRAPATYGFLAFYSCQIISSASESEMCFFLIYETMVYTMWLHVPKTGEASVPQWLHCLWLCFNENYYNYLLIVFYLCSLLYKKKVTGLQLCICIQ